MDCSYLRSFHAHKYTGWELQLLPRRACERWEELHDFLQGWGTRSQAQPESCRGLSHPFPAEDPGELPSTASRNPVPQREAGCRHMEPRWRPTPGRTHLRELAGIRMRAVLFAAVGALLLSPASCQSGKLAVSSFLMLSGGIATLCPKSQPNLISSTFHTNCTPKGRVES